MNVQIYSDPPWSSSCLRTVTEQVVIELQKLGHKVIWTRDRAVLYRDKPQVALFITFPSFLYAEMHQIQELRKHSVVIGHWDGCASWTFKEDELLRECFDGHLVALKADYEIGKERGLENIFWSPRGTDKNLLHDQNKSNVPMIMISLGEENDEAVSNISLAVQTAQKAKELIPNLRILAQEGINISTDKIVRGEPRVYFQNFLQPWTYISPFTKRMWNVNRNMLGGYFPDWMPTYEMSVIESQMAGCAQLAVKDCIRHELSCRESTVETEPTVESHLEGLLKTFDRFPVMQRKARQFALEHFDWDKNIKLWEEAIYCIIENKKLL